VRRELHEQRRSRLSEVDRRDRDRVVEGEEARRVDDVVHDGKRVVPRDGAECVVEPRFLRAARELGERGLERGEGRDPADVARGGDALARPGDHAIAHRFDLPTRHTHARALEDQARHPDSWEARDDSFPETQLVRRCHRGNRSAACAPG
jgi:hypothetical protein